MRGQMHENDAALQFWKAEQSFHDPRGTLIQRGMLVRHPVSRVERCALQRALAYVEIAHLEPPAAQGAIFLAEGCSPQGLQVAAGRSHERLVGSP